VEFEALDADAVFGLKLRRSVDGAEETIVAYDAGSSTFSLDRSHSGAALAGEYSAKVNLLPHNRLHVHAFVDRASIELFVNGGQTVMSARIFPSPQSTGVALFTTRGRVRVLRCQVWRLAVPRKPV
jgi:beta-fructofuranosidase